MSHTVGLGGDIGMRVMHCWGIDNLGDLERVSARLKNVCCAFVSYVAMEWSAYLHCNGLLSKVESLG